MKIHVLGAGNVGGNIIRATANSGHFVTVGVRSPEKISELLKETGAEVSDSCREADIIISTLPHAAAAELLPSLDLADKVLIDASNPLGWDGGPVHSPPEGFSSGAARLQSLIPDASVVKAFNTFGAEHSVSTKEADRALDHFIAGDDSEAKGKVSELLHSLNMNPIDLGPLRNAATLEHLAVAWIHLAMPAGWGRKIQLAVLKG